MSQPAAARAPAKPGARFKSEIEAAIASGASHDELLLNLTLMDASKLKRDPEVGVNDISFSEGQMRYLGILVKQGGVSSSQLGPIGDYGTEEPAAEPAPKKTKAKAKPKPKAKAKTAETAAA